MSQSKEIIALVISATAVGSAVIAWQVFNRPKPTVVTTSTPTSSPATTPASAITSTSPPTTPTSPPATTPATTLSQSSSSCLAFDCTPTPSGLFNYGGSTTWAPIRKSVDSEILAAHSQFKLRYIDPPKKAPGTGTGIEMLLEKQLSFSQASRPANEKEIKKANEKGFKLEEIPVAIDGIAVAVHPDLQVPGLTVTQLADIYLGNVQNWKQVGGPDLPITPYSRPLEAGGTVEFFHDAVLQKQDLGKNVKYVNNTTLGLRSVGKDQGGIYYASAPEVVGQCSIKTLPLGRKPSLFVAPHQEPFVPVSACPQQRNTLNKQAFFDGSYPITRQLFVIVRDDNSADEEAGRAYAALLLTDQGQELIDQAGFVRLR